MLTNKFIYSFILVLSLLCACKKDTIVDPPQSEPETHEPSARYKFLTSHYWRFADKWQDTTTYAMVHPELIPLPSSTNIYSFTDSCQYYTCLAYKTDGYFYTVSRQGCNYPCSGCPICMDSTGCLMQEGTWHLSEDEETHHSNYGVVNILTVNDSTFKYYKITPYNFTKKLITLYIYKAYKYK